MPLITVILTVYNRRDFIKSALDSVFGQDFSDYEILVADDSSEGISLKDIVDDYPQDRIVYLRNTPSLGVVGSIRRALGVAKGQYVSILNDDDIWEPTFLSTLSGLLKEDSNRVLAFCDHWIIDQCGERLEQQSADNTVLYGRDRLDDGNVADLMKLVIEKNGVPLAMAAMFRKDALAAEDLDAEVEGAYDLYISCLLARLKRPAAYSSRRLSRYRIHSSMETGRRAPGKNHPYIHIYGKLMGDPEFAAYRSTIHRQYASSFYSVGRDLLHFGRPAEARSFFLRSLRLGFPRAAMGLGLSLLPKMAARTR